MIAAWHEEAMAGEAELSGRSYPDNALGWWVARLARQAFRRRNKLTDTEVTSWAHAYLKVFCVPF